MKKYLNYLLLAILPLLLIFTGTILKAAQGPYYLNFYDPTYVYLISSLNLAQGFGIGHFDHPGTPVQLIGAVVVKLFHWISNPDSLVSVDALTRPEEYLAVMNKVFIIINCAVLLGLGILSYRLSRNLPLSLLIQLSPFCSDQFYYGLIIVTPENFLIAVTLIVIGMCIFYLYKIRDGDNASLTFCLLFAVICGLGVATKLNFIPVLAIPLFLLKGLKNKIIFSITAFLSFILFVIPAITNYQLFIAWVGKLFFNSGIYGSGNKFIFDIPELLNNLISIFKNDLLFTISYFLNLITLLTILLKKKTADSSLDEFSRKAHTLLTGIFFTMTLGIVFVAKNYTQHYMIPILMFSIISSLLSIHLLKIIYLTELKTITVRYISIFLLAGIPVFVLLNINNIYHENIKAHTESISVVNFVKNKYSDKPVVSVYESAGKECALAFACGYSAEKMSDYFAILGILQKNNIFYNPWSNEFNFRSNVSVKEDLLKNKTFILHNSIFGNPESFIEKLNEICGVRNSAYKKVFENAYGESVFEIKVGD